MIFNEKKYEKYINGIINISNTICIDDYDVCS